MIMPSNFFIKQRKDIVRKFLKNCDFVLDLGCGSGKFFDIFRNRKFVGLEIDPNKIKHISDGLVIRGDATNIPLKDSTIDGVLCTEVLEHVKDYKKVIQEIKRVLKTSGKALITTPNKKYEFYKKFLSFLKIWPHSYDRWIPTNEICEYCKGSFDVEVKGVIPVNLLGLEKHLADKLGKNSETVVLMLKKTKD